MKDVVVVGVVEDVGVVEHRLQYKHSFPPSNGNGYILKDVCEVEYNF